MKGAVPKRSDQRRRTNRPEPGREIVKAAAGKQVRPPAADSSWHPIAKAWYRSLRESGQVVFYEPSDWQAAKMAAYVISEMLGAEKLSAVLVHEAWTMMSDMLSTEASRRRARIELERVSSSPSDAAVAVMDEYRSEFAG